MLEQCLLDRADHPFAKTMLSHFEKLGTPLRSILDYPERTTLRQRFYAAGFDTVEVRKLWEIWSDSEYLTISQRLALNKIEPFDEWEEFALFASHYFLLTAHLGSYNSQVERRTSISSTTSVSSAISARTTLAASIANLNLSLQLNKNPTNKGQFHHGVAYCRSDGQQVIAHGGITPQKRDRPFEVFQSPMASKETGCLPDNIPPRACHSCTSLHNGEVLIAGGRRSPTAPLSDTWQLTHDKWFRVEDLPSARYRHSSAPVTSSDGGPGALIIGGKSDASTVINEVLLWQPKQGWKTVPIFETNPTPRFGASFVALTPSSGLYFGGMRGDGVVLEDFWRWRIERKYHNSASHIVFTNAAESIDASCGAWPWLGRLGSTAIVYNGRPATSSIYNDHVIVIGGIARTGAVPKHYEYLSIRGSEDGNDDIGDAKELQLVALLPKAHTDEPRPLLVGHSTFKVNDGILIVGGGAVCFSFGAYWNTGSYLLKQINVEAPAWSLKDNPVAAAIPTSTEESLNHSNCAPLVLEPTIISKAADFDALVISRRPSLMKGLDLGSCRQDWTASYLVEKIGVDRILVVHKAADRNMNFQSKNFAYARMTASELMQEAAAGNHVYLRSISQDPTQKPASLKEDFPNLANDFRIPPELRVIQEHHHSSPLRISGAANMWLHYDTMANVLFQIAGEKKMYLFPPSDILRLHIPAGATTSVQSIFDRSGLQFLGQPGTHPHEVLLKPGDALFLPPLWCHSGIPTQGMNVAVNVFFRDLADKGYAAGKDVYGNRDFQAYEDGRRDLQKIVRRFDSGIPGDIKKAYLIRLAAELQDMA